MKRKTFVVLAFVLVVLAETDPSYGQIVVQDADLVSVDTLRVDRGLLDQAALVGARIVLQYCTGNKTLNVPSLPPDLATEAARIPSSRRLILVYASQNAPHRLYRPYELLGETPPSEQPLFKAPWEGLAIITQGNRSQFTHRDHGTWDNTYAVDVVRVVDGSPVGLFDVLAPAEGTVVDTLVRPAGGLELVTAHRGLDRQLYYMVFLHLSEVYVREGQAVAQGQVIARSGASGSYVTGAHLHFHLWRRGVGSYDSHTIPIERLLLKQVGVDSDFREYDARRGDLDDDQVSGRYFESNNVPIRPQPDLIIRLVIPQSPTAGEVSRILVRVANSGEGASPGGHVRFGVTVLGDDMKPFQGHVVDGGQLDSLASGSQTDVEIPFRFISSAYSKYLEVQLIPEPGMDAQVSNNSIRVPLGVAPNPDAFQNCVAEITTVLTLGLLSGTEDLEMLSDAVFFVWDTEWEQYDLDEDLEAGDVREIAKDYLEIAWDASVSLLSLAGKAALKSVLGYGQTVVSLIEAGRHEATFQGCGEVLPFVWDTMKSIPRILWDKIMGAGASIFAFFFDSPVDVVVTDSNGNQTGVVGDSVSVGIDDSYAFALRGHKGIIVLGEDRYTLSMVATDTGSVGITLYQSDAQGQIKEIRFDSVQVDAHTTGTLRLSSATTEYSLALDVDGDGQTDRTLAPDQVSIVTGVSEGGLPAIPTTTRLWQNYPNPFNAATGIRFDLAEAASVELRVYDLAGRLVKVLASGRYAAGTYRVSWDGTDRAGTPVPSGLYFCRATIGNSCVGVTKMLLLR